MSKGNTRTWEGQQQNVQGKNQQNVQGKNQQNVQGKNQIKFSLSKNCQTIKNRARHYTADRRKVSSLPVTSTFH